MTTPRTSYRLAVCLALLSTAFLLFGIGALGIVGDGGPPDLLYVGALAVGLVVAALARFRTVGLAHGLGTAAALTLLAGVLAVTAGLQEDGSVVDVLALSALYAALWGTSAWLFGRAAARPA